ncbi:hypothetical protein HDV00_007442 [Rhizophlyctis rosea]|nr:hypothetical protein HDV00_007442 [Rhizophlyctis rosea]
MDGTPLQQCGIQPGGNMTYRFTADPPGTHWWHAHYKLQLLDGVLGPFIVHDNKDPYRGKYDEERLLFMGEWANETAESQWHNWKEFESAYYYKRNPQYNPIWDSHDGGWFIGNTFYNWTYGEDGALIGVIPFVGGLINGKTYNNTNDPAIVSIEQGKTYRFRLIGFNPFYPLEFSIDNHTFDVIAADGQYLKKDGPFDYLMIHGGERFDVLLKANKPVGNYWIRYRTNEVNKPNNMVLAILRVTKASQSLPTTLPANNFRGNTTLTRRANCLHDVSANCVPISAFKSLQPKRVPNATQEILLNLRFLRGPLINTIRNQEPKFPPLYAANNFTVLPGVIPCNGTCTETYGCNCTNIEEVKYGEQIRLFIENPWYKLSAVHPIHVHGHSFSILAQGWSSNYTSLLNSTPSIDPYNPPNINVATAPLKDTVIVPAGGWTLIQFTADNPGAWMVHCHMEHHLNDGMGLFLDEGRDVATFGSVMPQGFPACIAPHENGTYWS